MTKKLSAFSRFFSKSLRSGAHSIPTHLMSDCGFEAEENKYRNNAEIERMTLILSTLR